MKARAVIVLIINDVVQFFNVGKTMNDNQVAQTADLILDNFGYLKIEDFKYCFSLAKMGHFGQVYDRLDGQIILSWLSKYEDERCEFCAEANYQKHLSDKESDRNAPDFLSLNAGKISNFRK